MPSKQTHAHSVEGGGGITCLSNGTRAPGARTHYVTPFFLVECLGVTLPIDSLVIALRKWLRYARASGQGKCLMQHRTHHYAILVKFYLTVQYYIQLLS
jgi:hypothetical protein